RELGCNAAGVPVAEAIGKSEVIILAIHFDAIKQLISAYSAALAGKIIAGLLPKGVQFVEAFGTLGAESLASGTNRSPQRAVLFYATDHPDAGRVVADPIAASGFSPVLVGGINTSIRSRWVATCTSSGNSGSWRPSRRRSR